MAVVNIHARKTIKINELELFGDARNMSYMVYGDRGTCKTYLAEEITRQLLFQGEKVVFYGQTNDMNTLCSDNSDHFWDPTHTGSLQWQISDDLHTYGDAFDLARALFADNWALRRYAPGHIGRAAAVIKQALEYGYYANRNLRGALTCLPVQCPPEYAGLTHIVRRQLAELELMDHMDSDFSLRRWLNDGMSGGLFILADDIMSKTCEAVMMNMLLKAISQKSGGRHVYVIIDDLLRAPGLPLLARAMRNAKAANASFIITADRYEPIRRPDEDFVERHGLKSKLTKADLAIVTDAFSGVIALKSSQELTAYLRKTYGDEFATLDECPSGHAVVRLNRSGEIELREVQLGGQTC